MKKSLKLIIAIVALILVSVIGIFAYLGNYYRAIEIEDDTLVNSIRIYEDHQGYIVYEPQNPIGGFIFYPGGKVENKAYEPLMKKLADNGILCILLKVPGNLAILDINAADGFCEQYPNIQHWAIGGHSLGGTCASMYLSKTSTEFESIVFLGAYASKDLSQKDIKALLIYGSEDGVMNRTKYEDAKKYLPADYREVVIEGGCHAYFGSYGEQKGDGVATITPLQQMDQTVEAIIKLFN